MDVNAIILCAGKGTRMKQKTPKCIMPLLGKPMIKYIVDTLKSINITNICIVINEQSEIIKNILGNDITYYYQLLPLGTANALSKAIPFINKYKGFCLIIPGDIPLLNKEHIQNLINIHKKKQNEMTLLTTILDNPTSYGRIIKHDDRVLKIVEESDATKEEKKIKMINSGVYIINNNLIEDSLSKIKNNNKLKEFYLTDIVKYIDKVSYYNVKYTYHLTGINDLNTLIKVSKLKSKEINEYYISNGVSLIKPETIEIGPDVIIGSNVTIDSFCILRGNTFIKDNSYIKPYTYLLDGEIIK